MTPIKERQLACLMQQRTAAVLIMHVMCVSSGRRATAVPVGVVLREIEKTWHEAAVGQVRGAAAKT